MIYSRDIVFWSETLDNYYFSFSYHIYYHSHGHHHWCFCRCCQTCLPQNTSVHTPNSHCPYFQIFDQTFCGCTTNQSTQNSVNFSIIHLVRRVRKFTSSIIQTHYTHQDDFILFASAKAILDQRPQNNFSKNSATCVLLSLMPTHPFLNGCCLVRVYFLGLCILPPLCRFRAVTYHQQLRIRIRHIRRWLPSIKFRCKVNVHWFNKLFWPIRTGRTLQSRNDLKYANVNER